MTISSVNQELSQNNLSAAERALFAPPPPPPTATQTAAKWVGRAVDPRGTLKLLGRGGVALGALALQIRSAAATAAPCYEYKNFQSPNTANAYAVRSGCGVGHTFLNDFVTACNAKPANGGYPEFWHRVKYWSSAEILRQQGHAAPADVSFEACLVKAGAPEAKHQAAIGGIIVGAVLGALLLVGAVALGIKCGCCRRRATRDVEAGGHTAVPVPAIAPTLPPFLPHPPTLEMARHEPPLDYAHAS